MHLKVLPKGTKTLLEPLTSLAQAHHFVLAGGTALALQLGHRESVDFDFFSERDFSTDGLLDTLSSSGKVSVMMQDEHSLACNVNHVKLSFFRYWDGFLFKSVKTSFFPLASINDIAVMKLVAIANRGSRKDFIDLYFILKSHVSLHELFKLMHQKYHNKDFNEYHVLKSLNYFDDAESEPMPKMLVPFRWDSAKDFFAREFYRAVTKK